VFAGWFFLALRVGFGIHAGTCVIWTTVTGLAIAALTYLAVRKLTPA
jgi:hypothetical protein